VTSCHDPLAVQAAVGDGVLRDVDITGSHDVDVSGETDSLDRQAASTREVAHAASSWGVCSIQCLLPIDHRRADEPLLDEQAGDGGAVGGFAARRQGPAPQLLPHAPHGQLQVNQGRFASAIALHLSAGRLCCLPICVPALPISRGCQPK
jgi:hypothetical protein